jgi:CheY-like chemotaxis protein
LSDETNAMRPLQILVVDDNDDVADAMAELLEDFGHEVRVARDGAAALRAFGDARPDVALIDVSLPDMSGYDVARAVRTAIPELATRLVAVTGHGGPDHLAESARAGFSLHVEKPVAPDDLERIIAGLQAAASAAG